MARKGLIIGGGERLVSIESDDLHSVSNELAWMIGKLAGIVRYDDSILRISVETRALDWV